MELKVLCDCGQKFKFDVEPVQGRMPFLVNCPSCGNDSTPAANTLIAQSQVYAIAPVVEPPIPVPVSAAPAAAIAPAPTPTPAPGGLRLSRPTPVEPPIPPPVSTATITPPPPRPRPGMNLPVAAVPKYLQTNHAIQNNSFPMGVLGSFAGAIVGLILLLGISYVLPFLLYFWYVKCILGMMVGGITGYGARLFYRGTDMTLGAAAALAAFVVVGGTFFGVWAFTGHSVFLLINGLIFTGFSTGFAFKIASG